MEVSGKTYQYRLLGSGLRTREALEDCYRAAAGLGWFRSYVLYAHDKPVAFQVGDVYLRRFHAQEIGYDPDWARHTHRDLPAEVSIGKASKDWRVTRVRASATATTSGRLSTARARSST